MSGRGTSRRGESWLVKACQGFLLHYQSFASGQRVSSLVEARPVMLGQVEACRVKVFICSLSNQSGLVVSGLVPSRPVKSSNGKSRF